IGVVLTEARMEHVLFNQCNLQLASLGNSRQRFVKYDECILEESDFYENDLKHMDFTNSQLSGINFTQTKLNKIDLSDTHFTHFTKSTDVPDDLKVYILIKIQAVNLSHLLSLVIK